MRESSGLVSEKAPKSMVYVLAQALFVNKAIAIQVERGTKIKLSKTRMFICLFLLKVTQLHCNKIILDNYNNINLEQKVHDNRFESSI